MGCLQDASPRGVLLYVYLLLAAGVAVGCVSPAVSRCLVAVSPVSIPPVYVLTDEMDVGSVSCAYLTFFVLWTEFGNCLRVGWMLRNALRTKYLDVTGYTSGTSCQVKMVERVT
jgi:hypothetical protein